METFFENWSFFDTIAAIVVFGFIYVCIRDLRMDSNKRFDKLEAKLETKADSEAFGNMRKSMDENIRQLRSSMDENNRALRKSMDENIRQLRSSMEANNRALRKSMDENIRALRAEMRGLRKGSNPAEDLQDQMSDQAK